MAEQKKLTFVIKEDQLLVDTDACDIEAFCWNAPGNVPIFFVFTGPEVHIITLEDGELPFTTVIGNRMRCSVQEFTDEMAKKYQAAIDAKMESSSGRM